ncbi:MAG: tail fiber domain-containing protein [bacterium]
MTDSNGIRVPDGVIELELTVYDAAAAGNQLYTACSADGTATGVPTAVQATFTNGVSSILIGSALTCAAGSAVNIPATLFNNTALYLGVTVEADAEMTPRKQIVAAGYAMNADRLDDLETGNAGDTSAYVPVADANGNLTITGNPQGAGITQGSFTVNPTLADANEILFGVALNGSARFSVDEDGDVSVVARLDLGVHGDGIGLNLPTSAGVPVAAVGTVEGDIVWDSTNDDLYIYDGAAFLQIGGGVGGGITQIGSMSSATSFGDATADDDWLGLGAGAGNILFDDQATDEVIVQNANFGVNIQAPATRIHALGGVADGLNEVLRISGGSTAAGSGPTIGFQQWYGNGAYPTWKVGEIGGTFAGGGGYDGILVFYTNNGANETDLSEKMRIDNDGYVGIGDASPTALLTVGNGDLFTVGSTGIVSVTRRLDMGAHGDNVGFNVVTNAGAPVTAAGNVEGDMVWDSTGDDLWIYSGAGFTQVTGLGITQIGSMTSATAFGDATADDDWLGLGVAAGNILFDDQATDEVIVQNANFGVNIATPAARIHALGGVADGLNEVLRVSGGSTSAGSGPSIGFQQWYATGAYPTWRVGEIGGIYTSGSYDGALVFRTNSGASETDLTEKMRINKSGDVGIGASTTISSMLHVNGDGGLTGDNSDLLLLYSTTDEPTGISLNTTNQQWFVGQNLPPDLTNFYDDFYVYNVDDAKTRFLIEDDGTTSIDVLAGATSNDLCYSTTDVTGMYTFSTCAPSSLRYKENVRPLDVDIEKVLALEPVRFDWKQRFIENPDGDPVDITPHAINIGLIAENTLPLVPDLVEFNSEGQVESVEYKLLSVYNLAVLKQHHLDIARSLKLDQLTGTAYEIDALQEADAVATAVDSKDLTFAGSTWNEITASAEKVSLSLSNKVNSLDEYGLTLTDNAGNEVARFGNHGDLYLGGRLYLSDRGAMQSDRYIYYDGSAGAGGDFMRTNAAGWSTGSYDFAEMFRSDESLQAGELVMLDVGGQEKVRRATDEFESNGYLLAGIVSTRPGFLAGMNEADSYPIALQGRVPTKVSLENGPIEIGDPIAISSVPGVGMKATQADYVVGLALESYAGGGDGKIAVFLKVGWYDGRSINQANNSVSSISISNLNSILDLGGQPIVGIGALEGFGGLWRLDSEGKLTVKEVEAGGVQADRLSVRAEDDTTTIGEGIIPVGSYEYVVENPMVKFNSRIFVTFFGNIEGTWWIDERKDGRFKLKLSAVATTDVEFEYWVLDVVDGRSHTAPEPPDPDLLVDEEVMPEGDDQPVVVEEPDVSDVGDLADAGGDEPVEGSTDDPVEQPITEPEPIAAVDEPSGDAAADQPAETEQAAVSDEPSA